MTPRFVISMLALDGLEMSKACIASILASRYQNFVLHLTSNGSKDGTVEYFKSLTDPRVRLKFNEENEGFIKPNCEAYEWAKEQGAELFVTCNNDLTVPPEWLDEFVTMFDANPKVAVSGPQGTISNVNAQMVGDRADKYLFAEGSCMCVRIAALPKDEPLFADYLKFIYMDDLELALRMQRRGWEVKQANFRVSHRNGSTCMRHPDAVRKCREAMTHNQRVMLKRWSHWNKVRRFDFPIVLRRKFASGDILLMTPIIRALKELWPLCPIDVECGVPEILKGNPLIRRCARVIPADPHAMVVNLDGAYERHPNRHVLESYAEAAGVDAAKVTPKLDLYYENVIAPSMKKGEGERWCAVHIGPTTWPGKNWPMDRWAEVVAQLKAEGWKVRLFGNKDTRSWKVDDDMRGQSGVQGLAALIAACDLFVGLDSFPMHVAQAVGVPVVALFGITDPRYFMTKGTADAIAVCSAPEHVNTGRRNRVINVTFLQTNDDVMKTISVAQVMEAVTEITKEVICGK